MTPRPAKPGKQSRCSRAVRLRKVTEADLPVFYEHQADPEAFRMASFAARDYDAFMVHWHKIMQDRRVIVRTVIFEGRVAGNIVAFWRGETREVGYWIGRDYWGKGIATEALSRFLRLVRGRPLYAGVAKHNLGSIRVLQKCGFVLSRDEGDEFILKLTGRRQPEAPNLRH